MSGQGSGSCFSSVGSGAGSGSGSPSSSRPLLSEADLALFAQLGIPIASNDDLYCLTSELGDAGLDGGFGNWNPDLLNNAAGLGDAQNSLQTTEDLLAALDFSQSLLANQNVGTNELVAGLGAVGNSDGLLPAGGPLTLAAALLNAQQQRQFAQPNNGGPSNLSNQPPRFFPLPPSVAAMASGTSPLLRSSLASKPPVLRKACNFCTRRRRRCDGLMPACRPCSSRGLDCVYEANKKMLPRTPYGNSSPTLSTPTGGHSQSQSVSTLYRSGAVASQPKLPNLAFLGGPGAAGAVGLPTTNSQQPTPPVASTPITSSVQTAQAAINSYFVAPGASAASTSVQPIAQLLANSVVANAVPNHSSNYTSPPPLTAGSSWTTQVDHEYLPTQPIDPLLEVLTQSQETMSAVRQVARELSHQRLITEVTTEEGLKQAFITHVVPRMPAYLRAWFFTGVTRDSEFGEYLMDPSDIGLSFAEPSIYLPLIAGCKKLLLKHVSLPAFLPSLTHLVLFATVLCNMAVDPNGELGLPDVDSGQAPEWSPLANPKSAREVDSLLRICIEISLRMGINKEPTTRLTVGEQPKTGNNKEGGSLRSEVELLDGILLMDGAGASMNTDRQDMIRKIWWLQYMTDRMASFLTFRKPSIDDAECNIFPPSHVADLAGAAGAGIASPKSDISVDIDELEAKVSDLHLHTLSLLGRVVQYRVACAAFKADPLVVDDPQRQSLEADLGIFRRNLPSLIRAFDSVVIPAKEAASISNISHELLQHLVFDALTLNSADLLLVSPSQHASPQALADWVDSAEAVSMCETGISTAQLVCNAIWAPAFTRGHRGTPITGLAQADVFTACMALVTLVRRLEVGS